MAKVKVACNEEENWQYCRTR